MAKSALAELLSDALDSSPEREDETQGIPLDQLVASYQDKQAFAVGDKVRWKRGLSNKKIGKNGDFIVIEVLSNPIYDLEGGAGSGYYREPLDIRVASKERGGFIIFYLDSARLEKVA